MHLGDKLKLHRKAKDLDQFQMADLLGVSVRTYGQIEKTGIVTKAKLQTDIRKLLSENQKQIADLEEAQIDYGSRPMEIIDRLSRALEKMTSYTDNIVDTNKELVINNQQLTRNNTELVNKFLSSSVTDSTSRVSQEKAPLLPDPTAPMRGRPDTDSGERKGKQRDISRSSGK